MEAQDYLTQIRTINKKIEIKARELDKRSNSLTGAEKRLRIEIGDLQRAKESILDTIGMLSPVHSDFLLDRYVLGKSLKEIAQENGRSYSWATTTHYNAKKKIAEILKARESEEECIRR